MRAIPNDIVQTLLRTLLPILDNVNEEAIRNGLRLNNAVRLTKNIIKRLEKIECNANSETRQESG